MAELNQSSSEDSGKDMDTPPADPASPTTKVDITEILSEPLNVLNLSPSAFPPLSNRGPKSEMELDPEDDPEPGPEPTGKPETSLDEARQRYYQRTMELPNKQRIFDIRNHSDLSIYVPRDQLPEVVKAILHEVPTDRTHPDLLYLFQDAMVTEFKLVLRGKGGNDENFCIWRHRREVMIGSFSVIDGSTCFWKKASRYCNTDRPGYWTFDGVYYDHESPMSAYWGLLWIKHPPCKKKMPLEKKSWYLAQSMVRNWALDTPWELMWEVSDGRVFFKTSS